MDKKNKKQRNKQKNLKYTCCKNCPIGQFLHGANRNYIADFTSNRISFLNAVHYQLILKHRNEHIFLN